MSLSERTFTAEMKRVIETFGAQNFPEPRMKEIWKVVKDLPERDFERIVSRMVGEIPIKYPPTVLNFREMAETKLKELRDRQGVQGWATVADELALRKQRIKDMTPEAKKEHDERLNRIRKQFGLPKI